MDTMEGQEQQQSVEPQEKKASLWEDIIDVFIAPADLYRRRARDSWVKPWIVVSVISAALYYVFLPATKAIANAAMQEAMAKRGVTEVPASAQGIANTFQLLGGIIVPIGLVIGILLLGFLIWLVAKVAGNGPTYKQSMLIVAWSTVVGIIQQVLMGVLIIMKNNSGDAISPTRDVSFGVVRFLQPDAVPAVIIPLLNRLDIFAIWQALLWLVALKVICKWSTGKATVVAFASWILVAIPMMIWAMVKPA